MYWRWSEASGRCVCYYSGSCTGGGLRQVVSVYAIIVGHVLEVV